MSSFKKLKSKNCRLMKLNKIIDPRGNITFLEEKNHVPFDISRVYYLYDTPSGAERGGHAHYDLQQLIIAVSGSFDVIIDDGSNSERITLLRPDEGLLISSMIWRELKNFSGGAVCLVLASNLYSESDYIRSYDEFRNIVNKS
tara:strand:+ start:9777 stop:10205 length:429 start_codon:yes stop_codon:yes gene_type:complete